MIQVIIADDHTMFRQGLAALIKLMPDVSIVGQARDGRETLDLIVKFQPDIAVVDISMPELSGIDVLKEVRQQGLSTRIILLTMHTEPELAEQAMKLGTSGYLLKENAFEDLMTALHIIYNGGTFISPAILSKAPLDADILSSREKQVLRGISKGMTNKEIANELDISPRTVETYRANIMNKLNLHTTADMVKYAIKRGIDR